MSITKRLMLSSMFNHTWPKYLHEKNLKISDNQSNNQILSDTTLSSTNSWIINRFTIVQRSFFILSLVSCFLKRDERVKKNVKVKYRKI